MRGRKPSPSYLQIVKPGTHAKRKGREFLAATAVEPGAMAVDGGDGPGWLCAAARERWQALAPELIRLNLLTALDRDAFAAYCQAYAHMVASERALAESGSLVVAKAYGGYGANPLVAIAQKARLEVQRLGADFGLSPSPRSRLRASTLPVDSKDPAKRFLG